jgi:NitT/TauT family transport system ATP-binding protein
MMGVNWRQSLPLEISPSIVQYCESRPVRRGRMTVIASLQRVSRVFDSGVQALGPLDLAIEKGEFISLLGPSGCGKSTCLRIIAELLAPSAGTLHWPEGKPRIGFVFQDPTLMPWAIVRDNVRLPLDLTGTARDDANAHAEAALARVGLAEFAQSYPRALSGGMRMRVSIARALAARPQLLLMDEPFAALDEISREALNQDLLRLWREDGLTIVFVTHSVYESTFLSTRIVTMTPRPGRVAHEFRLTSPPYRNSEWRMSPEFADAARAVSRGLRDATQAAA